MDTQDTFSQEGFNIQNNYYMWSYFLNGVPTTPVCLPIQVNH